MDNPRPEKVAVVTEVREHFERSNAAILTEYRGLTVKDLAGLRRTLRDAGGDYKIYKNTLVRFAANDLGLGELGSLLVGPTAIAFVDGDASIVAKALRDYAKTNPKLVVKGGVLGKRIMTLADATALADLPPREVVLARLAGALASPMQAFAGLLQAIPRSFAYGLKALIEKRGGDEGADAMPVASEPVATDASVPVGGETPTSADASAAEPAAAASPPEATPAAEPEPAAAEPVAAEPAAAAAEPAGPAASEPEAVAEPEPEPNVDAEPAAVASEPAAAAAEPEAAAAESATAAAVEAAVEAAAEPDAAAAEAEAEAVEPPPLEDAAEAALTPALVNEPAEVEPLAAHGIPSDVEPEILSVAPEPPDAPVVDDVSTETPPA